MYGNLSSATALQRSSDFNDVPGRNPFNDDLISRDNVVSTITEATSFIEAANSTAQAVIWARTMPQNVRGALSASDYSIGSNRRVCVPIAHSENATRQLLSARSITDDVILDWISKDVSVLVRAMASLLSIDAVTIRIEGVDDNSCSKFHRDTVRARLVCTYDGPGTEYGMAAPKSEPGKIKAVATGHPVLFKGKTWSSPSSGSTPGDHQLVHRSPAIAGTGMKRLVLVVDEAASE
ncbi:MAG: DUF1826 domain-containing protein [Pseudomonadota bacterium]